MNAAQTQADVVLAGGGLANSLIAMRLKALRPTLRVIMLERELTIGGQHTWCHFATDVSGAIGEWLRPLFVAEWAGYDIRFPAHARSLTTAYRAISSQRLHQVVAPLMGEDAWLGVDMRFSGDRDLVPPTWPWAGRSSSAARFVWPRRTA